MVIEEQPTQENDDDVDIDDETANVAVSRTWKFITDRWKLSVPKLIISIAHNSEPISVNEQLISSVISNLVKLAAEKGI